MSAPRLGEIYKDAHTFWGTYRGHYVEVDRPARGKRWRFCVTNQAGEKLADGVMDDPAATRREAIIHAVRGAQLFNG